MSEWGESFLELLTLDVVEWPLEVSISISIGQIVDISCWLL